MQLISEIIRNHGIGVLPTDTLYGLVGSAFSKKAVKRIYKLRRRNLRKPMIILIKSINDLNFFDIKINKLTGKLLKKYWPGKVSIILKCSSKKFYYLHRGKNALAFRLPKNDKLIRILKATGPLVAPSANWERFPPAKTIKEAQRYFGEKADFYIDGGKLSNIPSTLIEINKNKVILKRAGAVNIKI